MYKCKVLDREGNTIKTHIAETLGDGIMWVIRNNRQVIEGINQFIVYASDNSAQVQPFYHDSSFVLGTVSSADTPSYAGGKER